MMTPGHWSIDDVVWVQLFLGTSLDNTSLQVTWAFLISIVSTTKSTNKMKVPETDRTYVEQCSPAALLVLLSTQLGVVSTTEVRLWTPSRMYSRDINPTKLTFNLAGNNETSFDGSHRGSLRVVECCGCEDEISWYTVTVAYGVL